MATVGELLINLSANTARLQQDFQKAAEIQKSWADKAVASANLVKGALATIGVMAVVSQFRSVLNSAIETSAGFQDMAVKAGTTVEALSSLSQAAKLSQTSMGDVTTALTKLSRGMAGSDDETKGAGHALEALGIKAKDLSGQLRDPQAVLVEMAQKLGEYRDGAGKTALVQDALGRSGAQLLPFMRELAETGVTEAKVTTEQAEAAKRYEDNLIRLAAQKQAVYRIVAMQMIPVMDTFVETLLKAVTESNGLKKSVEELAKDGSIRDWAESGAKGVAFLIDAFDGLKRVVMIVGDGIGALYAIQAAALRGDFAGIAQINREAMAKQQEILGKEWFGDKLKKQFEMRRNVEAGIAAGADIGGGKPQLQYSTAKEKTGIDSEYERYIRALQRYEEELGRANGMTESAKALYETTKGSLRTLTEEHKAAIVAIAGEVDKRRQQIMVIENEYARRIALQQVMEQNDHVRQGLFQSGADSQRAAEFQISLIGKTAEEVQRLTIAYNAETAALMAKRQLQGEDTTAAQAEIDAIAARQQAVMTELAAKQRAYERDFNIGAKSAFDKYADDATNAAKNVELVLTNSFRSAEDALVQFVQTGKLDFKSLVNSILADLARMELRQNVLGPIAQMMGLKTGSAGGSGGGLLGSVGSLFSGMGGGSSFFGGISDWFKGVQGIGAGTGAAFGNMDFGGFFADGGSTPPNSWVVVGEDGPELMRSGSGGGTVVPNSALGGGAPNVTINMINKGEPMSAQASAPRFDAGSWVIDVVTNRLRTDNNFRQAMQTANRAPI